MGKDAKIPVTRAIRALREHGVPFVPRPYRYVPKGGTAASSAALGVPEHEVVKTLVMEDDKGAPLVVLMHGDRSVSTKALARTLGAKSVSPCDPKVAERHSGYQVGGTSPLGMRRNLPVYVERTIVELPRIYINGGRRGLLVEVEPQALCRILQAIPVDVTA